MAAPAEAPAVLPYLHGISPLSFTIQDYLRAIDPAHAGAMLQDSQCRRVLTRYDPLLFALIYMSKTITDQDAGRITFADMHFELCRMALGWVGRGSVGHGQRTAVLAPRDSGKSTWLFKILPLWAAAHGHVRFVSAFSATGRQAERWMGNVKREIDGNALLRLDFPELTTPAVRGRSGRAVSDTLSLYTARSGFSLAAFGIDSSNLGLNVDDRRPDLIIFDDIEQDEANYSAYQKAKRLTTVIDTCMGMNLKASVSFVGTVTMTGSIFHDFVRLNDGEPDEDNRWVEEQRIRVRHFEPFVDDRSYWPGRWSTEFLRSIEHTTAFAKNLLNRPALGDGEYWSRADFTYGALKHPAIKILSIDPAVKDKKTNDYTAMSVIAFDPRADIGNPAGGRGAFEVIDSVQMRVVPGQPMVQRVLAFLATHPDIYAVLIEDNQGGQLWNMLFADLPTQLWTVTNTEPKWVRAQKVVNEYQLGKVLHRRKLVKLERQMISFPRVVNDDLTDSVTSGILELRHRYSVSGVDRVARRDYA